ncbi:MAG TPA: histidine phosphatase family protein [Bradyrhizobium sp.]|nr:histidine phosphatase family protein [Bradyrhizobium sp.]
MRGIRLLLCSLLIWSPTMTASLAASSRNDWANDLRWGGYVIVFRHGATTSDQKTDAMSNPDADPMSNPAGGKAAAGERQLDEKGRAQAEAIGASMRKLGIPVGLVLTSPLQRAVDTGMLMTFGEVQTVPELAEAGADLSPEENDRRAQALRILVALHPPVDSNLVIVSHKPNIVNAFGKDWSDVREGEASVFEPDGDGGFKLVVRVQADEWKQLSSGLSD